MTQLELANKVGVTPGMVSQWERGTAVPRPEMARRVDDVLGAKGEALEAFGYMPPGTLTRLAKIERVADSGVPALEALEAEVGRLGAKVAALEAALRAQRRRPSRASG